MLLIHTNLSGQGRVVDKTINRELQEVFFLMSSNPTQNAELKEVEQNALHYLQHRIARNPDDLRSHVQRIHLNVRLRDPEGVFGSILDLFIALSNKGIAIRRRMLSIARPQLSVIHRVFLSNSLQLGLTSKDVLPATTRSALSQGYSGTQALVVENDSVQSNLTDPLVLAQNHIDKVEIDLAREVLEVAVISQPWREDLHAELLGVYRATHDGVRIKKMYEKLNGTSIPNPVLWKETMQNLNQTTEKA